MSDEIRDFAEIVTDLRGGVTHRELSVALHDATEAAKRTGKMATVTLTIKIKPQGDRQVEVVDAIKKTIPEPNRSPTLFFVEGNGRLTRSDVRQRRLDELEEVKQADKPVVEVKRPEGKVVVMESKPAAKEATVQ